ncbi:MAG TPA: hypothetical protein VFT46_11760 [Holophagaceae bacterium]|nr:hypothetical protein [Holophagaceae bacterium]
MVRRAALPALLGILILGSLGLRPPAGPPKPPARLSETGLYASDGRIAADALPYSPQYPLWSDGAGKGRWIHLPQGQAIDGLDLGAWRFPVGTRLWKEFVFGGRRVETRMLWLARPGQWVYAAYAWRPDQSDADLVPEEGQRDAVALGNGLHHDIPSLEDCRSCHATGGPEVLGFTALQLSPDRDPNAPHAEPLTPDMVTLASLIRRGLLKTAEAPALLAAPPRIAAASPTERAALGYFVGNCAFCHQPSNPIPHVALDLRHTAAAERGLGAVGQASFHSVPGAEAPQALCPGDPARSAVLYRMASRSPSSQMPPLGTVLPDAEALALMKRWIAELKDAPAMRAKGSSRP